MDKVALKNGVETLEVKGQPSISCRRAFLYLAIWSYCLFFACVIFSFR